MGLVLKVAPATPLLPKIPLLPLHVWALHLLAPQIKTHVFNQSVASHNTPGQQNKLGIQ
jgi:hypothetical protein